MDSPLIIHIPHSSEYMPEDCRQEMLPGGDERRRELSPDGKERMLREYNDAHHAFLSAMVREKLAGFGLCIIMECRSFSDVPLPYETQRALPRPDFCIGTHAYHTPPELSELCVGLLRGEGFSVRANSPCGGALGLASAIRTWGATKAPTAG